jgi:hypothetical protein
MPYKKMSEVSLKAANLSKLAPIPLIGIIGKRRSGKTFHTKSFIAETKQKHNRIIVMCGTKDNKKEWSPAVHPLYDVVPKSLSHLEKVRAWQDVNVSKYSDEGVCIPESLQLTLVIEDCGSDKEFMNSTVMKDLLSNSRHYGITLILLLQCLAQLPSQNRTQLDYIGLLNTNNAKSMSRVRQDYCSMVDDRTFSCILKKCTEDRGMMWIDNTVNTSSLADMLFFVTAHDHMSETK